MQAQQPLQRISREHLSSLLLSPEASKIAIIDVRGDDHVGGHIHNSTHVPSTSLDYRIPQLVRTLADKQTVVFHCALSQERGPRAARRYMDEQRIDRTKRREAADEVQEKVTDQQVYVLDGGFVKWQEKCAAPLFFHSIHPHSFLPSMRITNTAH